MARGVVKRAGGAADHGCMPDAGAATRESILRVPAVRRLVVTYGISALGSAMVAVAVAFTAFRESGSVVLTVLVAGASALPALLLSPLVGRIATRRDPRTVEIVGQVTKAILSLALAVVAASGWLTYPVLLVANVLNGIVSALAAPAWPRLAKMSAPKGRLAEATAAFGSVGSVAAIVGALGGGVAVGVLGVGWVFGFNALSYLPLVFAVRLVPGRPAEPRVTHRAVRTGIAIVRRTDTLRRAFVLAAVLNLAAWPVLSVLPAAAHEIDARAHVLGLLTGAFYAGAAGVSFLVVRLRRRYRYGTIVFVGFFGAGLLLCANAALTAWRAPGYDAVLVAGLTLVPIGLAVALDSSLLQALVQLGTDPGDQAPVLVVYATITTIVTPLGGLAIGAVADAASLWGALALAGVVLAGLALALRRKLRVLDELGAAPDGSPPALHHHHLHLGQLVGHDLPGAFAELVRGGWHHDDAPGDRADDDGGDTGDAHDGAETAPRAASVGLGTAR